MSGKAMNGQRKVNEVRREGINQAKMWLSIPSEERGEESNGGVQMAAMVLVSTQFRMDAIQGKEPSAVKALA